MDLRQAFILALKSLAGSKMRSFLTMLGIIIGVASVIVLVAIVDGMSRNMVNSFASMGTNLITVNLPPRGSTRMVTPDQVVDFALSNPDVLSGVTPAVTVSGITAKAGVTSLSTTALGTNEYYPEIRNIEIEYGRYLQFVDVDRRQKNCVLGAYVAQTLFEGTSAINREIKINGDIYNVVGVVTAKQSAVEGTEDDRIYLPHSAPAIISRSRMVSQYSFSAKDQETVSDAMERINDFLLEQLGTTDAYRTFNQADALSQLNNLISSMTAVLVGVAAISLLVGGIGIMNIMLVSVTERTREIGIRKSLGAAPWDIMSQFVVESATTGLLGGLFGVGLGFAASYVTGKIMDMEVIPTTNAILIAFSVSVAIGMFFGYFPAKKASKLNPIDALRYD